MRKKILIALGVLFVIFIIGFTAFYKYSTNPQFCRSCHIMEPYYKSWKESKHNKVSCVLCHYPPESARVHMWKKIQAMSMVVKYLTGTYSSRAFAEIDNAACLRQGCHSERLLRGKLTFGRGVKFDHAPHLSELGRGKELRCVSCHSQVAIGRHVEVTLDTCYLCHFKGMKESRKLEPIGGCPSCHKLPEKEFTLGNIKYNYKDFVTKHGIECQSCHLDVIQGEGDAPKERCFSCHAQTEKLERYSDTKFIHENHIAKHGVACFHCHTEMKHSVKTVTASPKLDCAMCHTDMHTGQKDMYEGRGGRGLDEMPSPMYLAQVDCVGCHIIEERPEGGLEQKFTGKTYKASKAGCVKCHGEKYGDLVDDWKKELEAAIRATEPRLEEAKAALSRISPDAPNFTFLKNAYDNARYNYDFTRLSVGVHNVYYSAKLLQNANDDLDKFSKESKKALSAAGKASLLDGSYCATLCHAKLNVKIPEDVKYKDRDMPHGAHVELVGTCGSCHAIGRHKEMPLKDDLSICKTCHEGGM